MKKGFTIFLLVAGLLAAGFYGLSELFPARSDRVFAQLPRVRTGMTKAEVQAMLGKPDTTYRWPSAPAPLVWHYEMGPLAPDAVRVFLVEDTVTAVTYNH